jgi:hypothetical protein
VMFSPALLPQRVQRRIAGDVEKPAHDLRLLF